MSNWLNQVDLSGPNYKKWKLNPTKETINLGIDFFNSNAAKTEAIRNWSSRIWNNSIPNIEARKQQLPDRKLKIGKWGDAASPILDIANAAVGKPDNVSGANKAIGYAGQVAGIIPGPLGKIAQVGLGAVNFLDNVTAKNAHTQMTAGESALGYGLNFNAKAGTSYGGLFGNKARKNTNKLVAYQDGQNVRNLLASRTAQKTADASNVANTANINNQMLSGINNYSFLSAKKGGKLLQIKRLIYKAQHGTKLPEKEKNTTNVIAGGALHARKNNMEVFKGEITHKGIPVISGDLISNNDKIELKEGGEIKQDAEIEREEIIFRKQLTDKIEKNHEKFQAATNKKEKDDILIQTGKLLTTEILNNTIDNANIL